MHLTEGDCSEFWNNLDLCGAAIAYYVSYLCFQMKTLALFIV